jgi:hypothetical protein
VLRDHDARRLLDVASISDPDDPRIVALQRDVSASVSGCRTTA